MLKSCGTVDKVDQEECEKEGSGTVENFENKAEESFVGTSPISAHNSVSYNPPKNGLIASALEIPNSVCLSFEHVDPLLQSTSPPCSIKNTIPQDEKHAGLFTNIKNDLSTDHGLEFNKSENQEQCDKLMDLPNGSKQYNEVLIDGFAILSFKTMDDMLEFTKLDESQNPGMTPTIEQTYKRARRCGMPKLKRTKAFLKQTLSQTSTSNDLLRHRRHHHHHHNHSHYHFNNIHQHPALCAYKSHCDTNHMSSTIHLSPNHEKDTKSIVNTTITDGINKLSSIQPNNNSNGNGNKHYHHRSYEVNNSTSLHEETNHNDVHYRDDETPTPPLHHHNPYCFTLNLSTHTIATSNSPIDNTLISSNRSNHHSHNHSSLTTMPKKEHRYSQESIQSPPEYTSMISPKNHSIGNNITSSSSPPPQDYRSMSVPGIWSSRTKPDIISPQKTDKITFGNSSDTDSVKIMPKISVPSENLKRSDSINSSKSHCHQFSVAALTDEVMHSSAQSEESKSQPTIISKSPKHPSGKKRTYRKSEHRDIVNTVSDKYSHRRNEYDKSFAYSKFDNSTRVNRCTGVDNNGSNKSWNSAINDSLKGALYFPTTVGTNHNCERIHETVSKYSPMTNHNFNSTPFSLRNPADSLPAHSYLPPRGLQEPTSCGSQIRPLSSSSAHLVPPSVPSSICSNSFLSHQNLLKQFMGIDSETANQLLNDPRFMELYALTMATLSNNVDGVPDSILPPPVSRISLPNHANTIISTSVNSGNQNNNSCSRFKNGNTVGHLRTTDTSQFGETSLSHCGQQVNLSSIQNKLYPYSNMMMLGANRPPLAPSSVPQSSQTTSSSSINRLIPPNAESLSISQLQTDRSQAVLAAAYADREFVTSNSTLGKLKLSSQGIMINNGSDRNNNSTVPSSLVSSLQSTTNINCLSDSYNRNAQHFNMPPNPIIQRHHHLSSIPQSSIGTLESSTLHNSKSNSISSNLSCSLSSDSMLNKNFGSFPFKLFNGDLHNPVSSSSSSSLSTHNDRNTMMGLHKPEYMPSESVLRPNFPPPLQLIPPPLPPNIPPEFLKSFLVPDSSSSLFPGPKVNVTLNSSFLPSNPNLQSTQPLYSPMRVNHPNRSDKTNYNGILHRPVYGDKVTSVFVSF
ncbi:unnamed protein product [Schistosoma curassoni]|nr:unnamed protein product [Schistosoma curassoni]